MKVEINVPEVVSIFKEIQIAPEKVFEMVRLNVREIVGQYLTEIMEAELTHFLGREPYELDVQVFFFAGHAVST